MRRYCSENPGLELAAEVVLSLWQTNQQITYQATHDDLTRLLNRRAFWLLARHQAYLSQRQGLPLGIMMLDVDDFRAVNEAHGHLAGDRALRVVALVLEQRLRKSDVVARYGGEEFVVLCSGCSPDGLLRVAEDLRQGIAALDVDGVRVTVSIGLSYGAIVADADRDLEALIAAADEALYQAKHAGKNRVVQPVSV
jgi:diguanylate cyclase (GGDEF)-like protein